MDYHSAITKVCTLIVITLGLPLVIFANVYEGTIGKYPVWIKFDSQTGNGKISGTYFYCSTGRDIQLEGSKNGSTISFTEIDKEGKVTGRFNCTVNGTELSGTWTNSTGKKKFEVKAHEAAWEKMKDAQHEARLDFQDQQMLNKEFPRDEGVDRSVVYEYKSKYIRSIQLFAEYNGGPYPSSQSIRKVYNALTGETVNFWDEIDPVKIPELKAYVQAETQKKFKECRAAYPDSEWLNVFKTETSDEERSVPMTFGASEDELENNPQAALEKIFTAKNADRIMTDFHIDSEGIKLGRCGLFDFPHVIQAMDFCDYIVFKPKELTKYLKNNSILLTITK